jgi:hypothetical protein
VVLGANGADMATSVSSPPAARSAFARLFGKCRRGTERKPAEDLGRNRATLIGQEHLRPDRKVMGLLDGHQTETWLAVPPAITDALHAIGSLPARNYAPALAGGNARPLLKIERTPRYH